VALGRKHSSLFYNREGGIFSPLTTHAPTSYRPAEGVVLFSFYLFLLILKSGPFPFFSDLELWFPRAPGDGSGSIFLFSFFIHTRIALASPPPPFFPPRFRSDEENRFSRRARSGFFFRLSKPVEFFPPPPFGGDLRITSSVCGQPVKARHFFWRGYGFFKLEAVPGPFVPTYF